MELIAKYVDKSRRGLARKFLEVKGLITQEMIDRFFSTYIPQPITYSAARKEDGRDIEGQARFSVGSLDECRGLVLKLNNGLVNAGFVDVGIKYNGS